MDEVDQMKSSTENMSHAEKPRVTLRQIRQTVERMLDVIENPASTLNDRNRACSTIRDLLAARDTGQYGISLTEYEISEAAGDASADRRARQFDTQEAEFAEKLRELMKARSVTQLELASRVGCSQPAISQMLKRQCRPHKATIVKLADALGVDARELWPDIDVANILDTIAAVQQVETMSDAEADVARRALQRSATDTPAASLPKRKR